MECEVSGMEEQKEKFAGKSKALKFDDRYRELLDELKSMPRKTKEEKANRFLWCKNHERYDDFVMDVVTMYRSKEFEKLQKMMSKDTYVEKLDPDLGIATSKGKEFDWVVLMESLKSAVEDYTGENKKGETHSFLQSVGTKYNQLAQEEAGKNDAGLLPSDVAPENRYRVIRLAKKIKDVWEHTVEKTTPEEIAEKLDEGNALEIRGISKKEFKEAIQMTYDLDIVSLDRSISSEDGDTELGDTISNAWNGFEVWEEKEMERLFWKKFSENFLNYWKAVKAAIGLKNQEVLNYFLSKDILILLKLKLISVEDQSQYKEYLEPKCGQWCRRKRCTLKESSSNKGCYVRYGYFPGDNENETGDEEIYACLKSSKGSLYEDILNNEYTQSAYPGGVQNLDDMYKKPLKDYKAKEEKDRFEFTDVYLGKATGITKASRSRYREKYENNARKRLQRLFLNDD